MGCSQPSNSSTGLAGSHWCECIQLLVPLGITGTAVLFVSSCGLRLLYVFCVLSTFVSLQVGWLSSHSTLETQASSDLLNRLSPGTRTRSFHDILLVRILGPTQIQGKGTTLGCEYSKAWFSRGL